MYHSVEAIWWKPLLNWPNLVFQFRGKKTYFDKNQFWVTCILLVNYYRCHDKIHHNNAAIDNKEHKHYLNRKILTMILRYFVKVKMGFKFKFPKNHGQYFDERGRGSIENFIFNKEAMKCHCKCHHDWNVYHQKPSYSFQNIPRTIDMPSKHIKSAQKDCKINPSQKQRPA